MTDITASRLKPLLWMAAGLAAFASLAFAFASPAHVEDGWEYRGFFLAVAVAEMALAVALIVWSWRPEPLSGRDLRVARGAVELGAIIAAAGVLVYVTTWVTGVGHAGHSPETIAAGPAALDIVTKVAEVALLVVLIRLATLMSSRAQKNPSQA
ncbi:MAG: hypothetical protein ACXWWQ_06155 [Candidatus Limnocylindria bacterium]